MFKIDYAGSVNIADFNHADLIDRIEQQKALSKEDEQLLTEAVKEFKKSGAF